MLFNESDQEIFEQFKNFIPSLNHVEIFKSKLEKDLMNFKSQLEMHKDGKIIGKNLNSFVISEMNHNSAVFSYLFRNSKTKQVFENFENWLALYEPNVLLRGPPEGYIGDDELRVYTKALLEAFPELP